jgi:Cof subfamily protein (haloacid dehalogenase superfamily)
VRIIPRLIATDLDETISDRTVAAFARAEQAGARFVLVTGRPPRVMKSVAAAFGHRGTAICANGALTYDMATDQVIGQRLIPPEDLAAAVAALRAAIPGIGIAVEYADGHAADELYQAARWNVNTTIPRVPDDVLFARPAAKLLGRHMSHTPDELLAAAAPVLDGLVNVSHSNGKSLIEVSAADVSKASSLALLAARLGIGPQAVVAFGDMPNDLPMLAWAGTSCAVANAHPDVLAAATHVIGGLADDGVAAYLEGLFR